MEHPVPTLIRRLGGITGLAKKLGYTPSTVQGWKEREAIPYDQVPNVLAVAKAEGIELTFADVFPNAERAA